MKLKEFTQPANLEKYSFWWSEANLIMGGISLFKGYPILYAIFSSSSSYGLIQSILNIDWLIWGVASVYLAYRWYNNGQRIFGGKKTYDLIALAISVAAGIDVALIPILSRDIVMSILPSYAIWVILGVLELGAAAYLYMRWNASGKKLF